MPDGTANPNRINQVANAPKRARRRAIGVMALEPRVMYDAAAAVAVGTAVLDPTHPADVNATSTTVAAAAPLATDATHTTDPTAQTTATDLAPLAVTGTASSDTGTHQVVFIDPHVPDYQLLAAGVKPGEQVVILDANTDGVQQIADWLASHDEHNLDAIHIVSHGEDGTIRLGSTILAANDVNQFSQPLAAIGGALKPGGDILLYGCDVGQGAVGDMFMVEMSSATGGAHIAAASHLVGAASQGGSWDLNVQLGSIDVANPFTDATLASFNDILTNQIWFSTNGSGAGTRIEQVGVDGSAPTDLVDATTTSGTLNSLAGIAVDAARGKYFVAEQVLAPDGTFSNVILSGSLATGALDAVPVYTGPATTTSIPLNNAYISGLQVDAQSGELYFAQGVRDSTGHNIANETGIFKVSETGSNLTLADATQVVALPSTQLDKPLNFALDFKDNLVFFTDNSGRGSTNSDTIGVASLSGGSQGAVSFISAASLSAAGVTNTTGMLSGIAVDADHSTIYFTSMDTNHTDHNYILKASFNVTGSGATASATFGAIQQVYNVGNAGAPVSIVLDVPDGLFFVANKTDKPDSINVSGDIQVGRLDGSTPLTSVFEASTISGGSVDRPTSLVLETTPTVAAGSAAVFTQNGAAVAADAGLTVGDSSGQDLASASVAISGGTFLAGDTLTANTTGTAITASYDSTTGVLTLSGVDTAAHYQQVLETVAFSSSSTDATNGGADTQRSLTWTVSDGLLQSNAATSTVSVHRAPSVDAGATATFTGGGPAVTLDGSLTLRDPDGSGTMASATVSISSGFVAGDTLNFANQNGITGSYDATTGTLTLTGAASVASYQAALDSITYNFTPGADPTAGGGNTSRTITWVANDGAANSDAVTSTLNTVHAAPGVVAGATATFNGGGAPVTLDGTLTVTDVDSSNMLTGATVSISSGFVAGDTLNFTDQSGITGSYNAGVLTLTGTASVQAYQAALDSITYSFTQGADPTAGGGNTSRTITWVANDGVAPSNVATSTLDTVHVAPSVVPDANATFIGGGAPVTLDGAMTLSAPDSSGMLAGATVSISSGFIAGDTLNFANQNGISGSYDASTGVLTLSGAATVAGYEQALNSVTYSFTAGGDPTGGGSHTSRTISWVANDGVANSAPATTTLDTVHVAPTVAAGATATFTGGGPAVTLDGTITVGDVDSGGMLSSATVSISSGFIAGDTLNFADQNGITSSYDAAHGVLTLTGTASVQAYQAALDSVTYSFTPGGDPTGGGGQTSRTISFVANDGVAPSNVATSTLDTVHVAPGVVAGATATFTGGGAPVTLDGTLTVTDVDSGNMLTGATVSISSGFIAGDTLNFANQSGITGSYSAGVLTLTGTASVQAYQAALDSITYSFTPGGDPTGGGGQTSRTISFVANDGVAPSNVATSTLDTVHTPPSVSASGTATFTGGGAPVPLDVGVTVADPDSGGTLTGATVSISSGFIAGHDLLNFTNQSGITGSYDATTGTLTLTGSASLANYQAALASVTYSFTPVNGDPTQGGNTQRTVSWAVNDGVASSNSATTTVSTVNATHVAPSVAGAGNTVAYSKQGPAVVVDHGLTLSDSDSGGMLTGATVTISSGFLGGDTLTAVTTGTTIKASYNAATGVLSLTGSDSIAHYQSVLDSVTYSSTSNNPAQGNKDTTRTVTWQVNDGASSNNLSTPVISTIDLTPGQSVVHAPHGSPAASTPAYSATSTSTPTSRGDNDMVTYLGPVPAAYADEHDNAPVWMGTQRHDDRDDRATFDLRHAVVATDSELLAARRDAAKADQRHDTDGDKPVGKPGLLMQLKAAGRNGFVNQRQAMIKDLHKQPASR